MAQPGFPLLAALEHRQRMEELRQAEAARAQSQLAQAEGSLRLAELAHQAIAAEVRALQTAPCFDPRTLQVGQARLARAALEIAHARAIHAQVSAQIERARAASVTASQDRLALERLEATFNEQAQRQVNRAEAERLGEIGLARWAAQRGRLGEP